MTPSTTADLLPVTVEYRNRRQDLTLPGFVPVAEFLPTVVASHQWLTSDTAWRGFRLLTAAGDALDTDKPLTAQGVVPGALLQLQPFGDDDPIRYDDLVEALGDHLSQTRAPWRQVDSVRLSAFVAAALAVICGLILALGPNRLASAVFAGIGAGLLILVTMVVSRAGQRRQEASGGPIALTLAATILAGLCLFSVVPGSLALRLMLAGLATAVSGLAFLVLPTTDHGYAGLPATLGGALALVCFQQWTWQVPWQQAAGLVAGLIALGVSVLPWIGLAQMPVRLAALDPAPNRVITATDVRYQLHIGQTLTLALRVAAGVALIGLSPLIVVNGLGAALMAVIAVAQLFATRALYDRWEVYVGLIAGSLTLAATGILLGLRQPGLSPWAVAVAVLVIVFIIADNVIAPKLRPQLGRVADFANVAGMAAIAPLVALIWGAV